MEVLIAIMIFLGSILMVYNIVRYFLFIKKNHDLDNQSGLKGSLIIPLVLLIFFLIGYVSIGIAGYATLMVASILLGGSIFVFLFLIVMIKVVNHVRNTEEILANRYAEIKTQIDEYTKDALCTFRINLSKDEIEERRGEALYETDLKVDSYSELLESRKQYILDLDYSGTNRNLMSTKGLIEHYLSGQSVASEILLVKRPNGIPSFVKFEATITKKPVTDDIVAFITEKEYNQEVIEQTLLEKVLMDQYDCIAFISDGSYEVLISNKDKKEGIILACEDETNYESVYYNYILPHMDKNKLSKEGSPNPLRLSVIEKELKNNSVYNVDTSFEIDGKMYYKHFSFYLINSKTNFFLMLVTDSTLHKAEQDARNKELADALEKSIKANDARIRFFSYLSHNLRTPLNSIIGFSNLASSENDKNIIKEYLEKIKASGKELLSHMNDLFTMSLIETGQLESHPTQFSINECMDSLINDLLEKASSKNINIQKEIIGIDEDIICDKTQLEQIFNRLLKNAIIFSPINSSIDLKIEKIDTVGDSGIYKFKMLNVGENLSDEIINNLFNLDQWDQLDNDKLIDLPGVGLGMVIAKAYIDQLGGSIDVKQKDNMMEMTITFKFKTVKKAEIEDIDALKLLVVDDNEINREIAKLMLSSVGYEITLADDGLQALEIIKNKKEEFDAVLMDVQMPKMNGYEATKAIRELDDEVLANIPIIAMTANAYQEDYNNALEAGMDGYVTKPIDIEQIKMTLNKVLSNKK